MSDKNRLLLIDGSGYIFRAYYALPPLYRKSDGLPTGAVNGFCNMLYKLLEDTKSSNVPSHLRGVGITMLLTGLLSIAFMSFGGIQL